MGGIVGGGKPKAPDYSAQIKASEESLALQREQVAQAKKQAEEERREYGEQMASKRRALTRGGKRTLLSQSRFNPEMGIDEEDTLGAA